MADTMRAIQLREFGDSNVLKEENVPSLELSDDQALVRVHAASINPIDWKISQGALPRMLSEEQLPRTLGFDLSGTVEAVGTEISEYHVGEEVFGISTFPESGSYAEYTLAAPSNLAHKPAEVSHLEAAAVPTVGLTAGHALYALAELEPDQRILIHGAAGGVGHMAVQLANRRGAHVIGTASGYNEEYLRELGVDQFVDYRNQQFEEVLDPVDVVLDTIGGETQTRSFETLRTGGTLVATTQPPAEDEVAAHDINAVMVHGRSEPPVTVITLAEWLESGELAPTISETFLLSEIAAAHEKSEGQHARGKIVLSVTE